MLPNSFCCHLAIIPEADGGFSTSVLNLPGVASDGDTEEIAIENTHEAVEGAIQSYQAHDEEIPWLHQYDTPEGAKLMWIVVDVEPPLPLNPRKGNT